MRRGDYGDLYVQVKTEVPVYLNKEQKELLERFRKIFLKISENNGVRTDNLCFF